VDDIASDNDDGADVFSDVAHGESPHVTTVNNGFGSSSKRHRAVTTDQLQQQQYEGATAAGAEYVLDDEQRHYDSNAVYDDAACMHEDALQGGFGRGIEADGSVILYREGEGTDTFTSTTYTLLSSIRCTCCGVVH
jgi:hypothetical protein